MWNNVKVEQPPNGLSPEVHSLCSQYGLHSYLGVLCGWQWAIEHKDQVVNYEVELIRPGGKQTIHSNNSKAINEVMKVYRR